MKSIKSLKIKNTELDNQKVFWGSFFFIFLCWIPVWLAYYPGIFTYDIRDQMKQVIYESYSTHHSLIHTLFVGFFLKVGGKLGSYTAGIAIQSVVQMVIMATAFSIAVTYLVQRKASKGWIIGAVLFYSLFPVNSMLAISTTKDVIFSALVLLYVLWHIKMTENPDEYLKVKGQLLIIGIGVLLLLFRKNAVYAYALSAPLSLLLVSRGKRKKYLWVIVLTGILYAGANSMLIGLTHAEQGSSSEALSIPLQQIARVAYLEYDDLGEKLQQDINYFMSEEVISNYNQSIADDVKCDVSALKIEQNRAKFWSLWARLGRQYPLEYSKAFLFNSMGYWNLFDTSHARIYGEGLETRMGYLLTNHHELPEGFEVEKHSYFPQLENILEHLFSANEYQKIPVLSLIFCPAFYWWILFFYTLLVLRRKNYRQLIPVLFLLAYYLTLLLSPTVLIRYMYPVAVCCPVLLGKAKFVEQKIDI